ncbi:UNVERIFIED_CONTAM: hypothetical protein PYX00_004975 [Menopon gallinae]|uniref:Dolichol-phosphate mannosyltransferase subunit 3 n=1 Tax=Menopon gallinae TaxID=328185 RepID=A0AAW2I7M0_9NEOP
MTKLMQWLLFGVMFISVWFPLATNKLNNQVLEKYSDIIVLFPFFSLAFFGVYALTVIVWRVLTFNNCEVAAKELQCQIAEAKADLKQKGFIFK